MQEVNDNAQVEALDMVSNQQSNLSDKNQADSPQPAQTDSGAEISFRFKISRKALAIIASVTLVIAVGAVAGYILAQSSSNAEKQTESQENNQSTVSQLAGELALVEGEVSYRSNDSWIEAKQSQKVRQGNSIKTGPDSRAVINLDDGSAVRLDQSSEIELTMVTNENVVITQVAGRAYHRVEPGQLVYSVETSQATATALGTIFSTSTSDKNSNVTVLESKVEVENKSNHQKLKVDSGQTAVIDQESVDISETEAGLLEQSFYAWNQALDNGEPVPSLTPKPTPTPEPTKPTPTPTPPSNPVSSLHLTGSIGAGSVTLNWSMANMSAPKGFKVLKSHSGEPLFGKDAAHYLSDSQTRSYTWTGLHNKPTNFRVGVYDGSGIVLYSNTITLTPKPKPASAPYSGSLTITSATVEGGTKVKLHWTATNENQVKGWKVVHSTSTNPTYGQDPSTLVSPEGRTLTIDNLKSGKTYYFRVGAYIDSKVAADAYSNEVSVTIP